MTTAPEKIYLQLRGGTDLPDIVPINLCDATWCADRIDDSDVEYVRADVVKSALTAIVESGTIWLTPREIARKMLAKLEVKP